MEPAERLESRATQRHLKNPSSTVMLRKRKADAVVVLLYVVGKRKKAKQQSNVNWIDDGAAVLGQANASLLPSRFRIPSTPKSNCDWASEGV